MTIGNLNFSILEIIIYGILLLGVIIWFTINIIKTIKYKKQKKEKDKEK